MGFLDNSGDIIIDAVLTDEGRRQMALGTFGITQFALSDDEINYALYNPGHLSGSAYYDLEILQTPVLEAFTNNTSLMKSRLMTLSNVALTHLPILKLNEVASADTRMHPTLGTFLVTVNEDTEKDLIKAVGIGNGIIRGFNPLAGGSLVRIDQGIDSSKETPGPLTDNELKEDQYLIEIDSRLGSIVGGGADGFAAAGAALAELTIDDDKIALYSVQLGAAPTFVTENTSTEKAAGEGGLAGDVILGKRGTITSFKIKASVSLQKSDYLFDKIGSESTLNSKDCKHIDTIVRVSGTKTGSKIDLPVRFIKIKGT